MEQPALNKLEAVYRLREAAERHGRAEEQLRRGDSRDARAELLDARLELEEQTVRTLEACQQCGGHHDHACNVIDITTLHRDDDA